MKKEQSSLGLVILLGSGIAIAALIVLLILRSPTPSPTALPNPTLASVPPGSTLYEIDSNRSVVRFTLNELLRGLPTRVIGSTNRLTGRLAFDLDNLATAAIGPITIDANDLQTDSNLRNTSIRSYILKTDTYPLISFVPTSINNLPNSMAIGQTAEFTLTGQLTLLDTTQEETFAVSATAVSGTEISGYASATIARDRYGLVIPSVENVANVDQNVLLEIEFTATAVTP